MRRWIEEGANWPDGLELGKAKGPDFSTEIQPILDKLSVEDREKLKAWIDAGALWPVDNPDTVELAEKIRELIVATSVEKVAAEMAAYTETISTTGVKFELVPIPGGEFVMGSPESEPGRQPNEAPQHPVKISPFWMGKCEVTWDEYGPFMVSDDRRSKPGAKIYPDPDDTIVDMVSRPTKPFMPMNFGMPEKGHPAIAMTQHAASRVLRMAQRADRPLLPPPDRGRVGVCMSRRAPRPRGRGAMTLSRPASMRGSSTTRISNIRKSV